jgi:hypothetical protein
MTIEETWSVGGTIGVDFGGLKIETTASWSHAQSITYAQTITLIVQPGYKVCAIAFGANRQKRVCDGITGRLGRKRTL